MGLLFNAIFNKIPKDKVKANESTLDKTIRIISYIRAIKEFIKIGMT